MVPYCNPFALSPSPSPTMRHIALICLISRLAADSFDLRVPFLATSCYGAYINTEQGAEQMTFTLTIEMNHNETCEGYELVEVIRTQVAPELENAGSPGDTGTIISTDGEVIGTWTITAN